MSSYKNITYKEPVQLDFNKDRHILDVFTIDTTGESPVAIFIHGGTWISGSKDLYTELGQNLSKLGICAVIINYRLATDFRSMAADCALAVKWAYENINKYGGDKDRIFLLGHSAGGHLASLISLDQDYFHQLQIINPVKGCILIDAFGMNIGEYIQSHGAMYLHYIAHVFSSDADLWEKASPIVFAQNSHFPISIFVGTDSYPFLIEDNRVFERKLKEFRKEVSLEMIPGKSHQEMITQFRSLNNPYYAKIKAFLFQKTSSKA